MNILTQLLLSLMKIVFGIIALILAIRGVFEMKRVYPLGQKLKQFRLESVKSLTFEEIKNQDDTLYPADNRQIKWIVRVVIVTLIIFAMLIGAGFYAAIIKSDFDLVMSLLLAVILLVMAGMLFLIVHNYQSRQAHILRYLAQHPDNPLQVQPFPQALLADYVQQNHRLIARLLIFMVLASLVMLL